MQDKLPDPCTVAEAAARLGLSVSRVQKLATQGDPPPLRIVRRVGRAFLLDAASVRAYRPAPVGRPRDPEAPTSRYRKKVRKNSRNSCNK